MNKWLIWALFFMVLVETIVLIVLSLLFLTMKPKTETIEIKIPAKEIQKVTPTPTPLPPPTLTPSAVKPLIKKVEAQSISVYLSKINDYRIANGLGLLQEDSTSCLFANTRATEITTNFSHDGFSNRVSARTLPYKTYATVVENIAQDSDHAKIVSLWINSAPHAQNLKANISFGCVGESGDYFAFEGYKP